MSIPIPERSFVFIVQNFRRVGIRLHLGHDLLDHPVLINYKGRAHHAHACFAVVLLFLPYAVGLNGCQLRVGKQNERQIVFLRKLLMGGCGVLADAND